MTRKTSCLLTHSQCSPTETLVVSILDHQFLFTQSFPFADPLYKKKHRSSSGQNCYLIQHRQLKKDVDSCQAV